ncbi:hypothetical protein DIS15_02895 [Levilactobacillus brevis]|uniref:conserved phage C-terminal domain-containing protein n=1 Tax=Levilactobacillus brevis TaxID=1580 RepID=UPI00111ED908|nr:conserved phage C-terminal domain-containing protein [Levilactobacillus brevis]TOY85747.1 hypothetical protein DIS15_02895 [Levilactobacillus brevis]
MSNLLISEPPLQVLPSLAIALNSVDKAIILQQIHYWVDRSNNVRDGYRWVYNSISEWHKQFPWLAEKTVQRYLKDLEDRGLLITGNYNKAKFDRTKWYRIDYDALDNLDESWGFTVPTEGTSSPVSKGPGVITNTNRLPETTTETNKSISPAKAEPSYPWETVIDYLNEKTGRHFKHTASNRTPIIGRFKEGHTMDDFRVVIDNQCAQWLKDKKMNRFLQPSTLFRASNFEGYLEQTPVQQGGESYGGINF